MFEKCHIGSFGEGDEQVIVIGALAIGAVNLLF